VFGVGVGGGDLPCSLNLGGRRRGEVGRVEGRKKERKTHHSRSLHFGFLSLFKKSSVFWDIWPGGTVDECFRDEITKSRELYLDPFEEL
jgi:hypothetical protein